MSVSFTNKNEMSKNYHKYCYHELINVKLMILAFINNFKKHNFIKMCSYDAANYTLLTKKILENIIMFSVNNFTA